MAAAEMKGAGMHNVWASDASGARPRILAVLKLLGVGNNVVGNQV